MTRLPSTGRGVGLTDTLVAVPISPDTARELSRAAKQVDAFRQRRDALIVQAQAEGAGLREIARAAGLTHRAVAKIIERQGRELPPASP